MIHIAFTLASSALIVTTSHGTLGDSGKATGVYASEMTVPYYEFLDAGMSVTLASIEGGKIPVEPVSLKWPLRTADDRRFLDDGAFQDKVEHSLPLASVDFSRYDLIFFAGGWGAAFDLGYSEELGRKLSTEAIPLDKIMGSVCHGALGFLQARYANGELFVKGKHMTAVTNKQVEELGIYDQTPQHPETELKNAGALYESSTAFRDFFAKHMTVDGHLVTGQNQNDGHEVAKKMMELLSEKSPP